MSETPTPTTPETPDAADTTADASTQNDVRVVGPAPTVETVPPSDADSPVDPRVAEHTGGLTDADLVRVQVGEWRVTVSAAHATSAGLDIVEDPDDPVYRSDGEQTPPIKVGDIVRADPDDDYDDRSVSDLRRAVNVRNADRADDDQIQVGGGKNKPDLIAALRADDATHQ